MIDSLAKYSYKTLSKSNFYTNLADILAEATIQWKPNDLREIDLTMNPRIKNLDDISLTGLISHELSHPGSQCTNEIQTDLDVIRRGLGVYLAFERLRSGEWFNLEPLEKIPYLSFTADHVIGRSRPII